MARSRLRRPAVLPALLILCASCTAGPERDDTLPPSCPGSDDPAYAYTTADDSAVDILGLRPDAELVALTTDGGSSSPSFTPDGTSIVFARAYPGQPGPSSPPSADSVWIMNADGSDPQELMRMTTVDSVSVSPDGTRMVVIGQQRSDRPDRGLYVPTSMAARSAVSTRRQVTRFCSVSPRGVPTGRR